MLGGLWGDTRGNTMVTFAVMLVPLMGVAGGAVDYNRVTAARVTLQDAADAATIAGARAIELGRTVGGDPATAARQSFEANFTHRDAKITRFAVAADKTQVTVDATVEVKMLFLGILGIATMEQSVRSESQVSTTTLEIALTLDNTGSMDGTRMATLKSASNAFVDQLARQVVGEDRLKFAVVPFSAFVNVGPKYRGAPWIDNDARSNRANSNFNAALNRFSLYDKFAIAWPGCVETRPSPYDTTDAVPDAAKPDTLFVPSFWPDEPDRSAGYSYPNDYIPDHIGGGDIARLINASKYNLATTIDRSNSTFFSNYRRPKGPDFGCDITPVTPLTASIPTVKTALDAMKAFGSTNIPEGLAWGWRMLSPEMPFTEGRSYGTKDNQKIIVLMTDGANSISTYGTGTAGQYSSVDYPYHDYTGPTRGKNLRTNLDAKALEVCSNIKAKGIEIFTIGLELGTDTTAKDLLAACATDSGHFYDAVEVAQLSPIFDKIAQRIGRLRLAR
ncbi:vWA domain-containing protein [Prosthecomicrobium sp. N25]|uniref:vWA domain-containing protein n=1 Tax=Prosthecomicrobium sp. N25 TaxID=3129254 RepID=UPI003078A222